MRGWQRPWTNCSIRVEQMRCCCTHIDRDTDLSTLSLRPPHSQGARDQGQAVGGEVVGALIRGAVPAARVPHRSIRGLS